VRPLNFTVRRRHVKREILEAGYRINLGGKQIVEQVPPVEAGAMCSLAEVSLGVF
jgi:hypothetical protein